MKVLLIVHLLTALVAARPGLLRVPKVYNAVITSNQNLSPSRAFPVIQPVIHRTAFGYVPPLYYTQVAPFFAGPEVVHLPPRGKTPTENGGSAEAEAGAEAGAEASSSASAESSGLDDQSQENQEAPGNGSSKDGENGSNGSNGSNGTPKKKNGDQVPLSFYPNYHSLYYDPYFYAYNGFNPHLVPSTYYIDYQPYGPLEPIPPTTPKNGFSERLLPGYHDEKKEEEPKSERQKIPDVPPPPLPTAVPKNS